MLYGVPGLAVDADWRVHSALNPHAVRCVADPACHAWVWGKDQYTSGPETCFILGTTVASVRAASGRSYGCVRK